MTRYLDYPARAPEILKLIGGVNEYLRASGLDIGLRHLVLLRVSQINKCAYCVDLHSHEAFSDGEDIQRLNCLIVWRECDFYSDKEKAALGWAEALTTLGDEQTLDDAFEVASRQFDEKALADLSFLIATMNAWNRMGVGLAQTPTRRRPKNGPKT